MDGETSLSTQEVASLLKISKNTVYELIRRGELPSYRIGRKVRVDLQDLEYYKNKSRTSNFKPHAPTSEIEIDNSVQAETKIIKNYSEKNLSNSRNFIISGQELILDILTQHLSYHKSNLHALRLYTGSYNSLIELYKGNVSLASCNLWDSDTNTYNIPYVRRLLPGTSCILIRLFSRKQGFYVAKGNPKNINDWNDLTNPTIRMINREKGSGVRVLLDENLKKLNILHTSINGYDRECFSHFAVASAVSRGEADIAIGNEKTSYQVENIDFIPLQNEQCDLVIKKEDINNPIFKSILEILRSKEFLMEISGIESYDISKTGKIIGEI